MSKFPSHTREARRKYRQSPEGREKRRLYRLTPKAKEQARRTWLSEATKRSKRRSNRKRKIEALMAYGGEHPSCQCKCGCKEDCLGFLSIDHVNNDGQDHRNKIGGKRTGSPAFFAYLKRNGYPNNPPLQVLCFNCNLGRQWNGGECPRLGIISNSEVKTATSRSVNISKQNQPLLFTKGE